MPKEQLFLYIVQTTIIANATNLASIPESAERYRHVISASGTLGLMQDVLWASERIPQSMSAADAADSFCGYMLANLRDIEESAYERKMQVPHWFARS